MDGANENEQKVAEAYFSSLVELNTNSKPLINMLTMLADENNAHGQIIVDTIQQRITKVSICFFFPSNSFIHFFLLFCLIYK